MFGPPDYAASKFFEKPLPKVPSDRPCRPSFFDDGPSEMFLCAVRLEVDLLCLRFIPPVPLQQKYFNAHLSATSAPRGNDWETTIRSECRSVSVEPFTVATRT